MKYLWTEKGGLMMENELYVHYCSETLIKFHSPIKSYHYNDQYYLWTIVLNNDDTLFLYDKNIYKMSIIKEKEGMSDYDVVGLAVNGKMKIYVEMGR